MEGFLLGWESGEFVLGRGERVRHCLRGVMGSVQCTEELDDVSGLRVGVQR
jgi:hypothetical protein